MALVKVLALDATGVIETEIDTGSGGGGGSGGSIVKHTIELTNGQTAVVVPGGYTSDGIAVYLNGAYLSPAEYTATTSPNITLATGAPSEDSVLDVLVFAVGTGGDAVTAANICDLAVDGTSLINTFLPYYYKPGVGVAQLITHGAPATAPLQHGSPTVANSQTNVGSGAGTSQTAGLLGELGQTTGTTSTGYSTFYASICPAYTATPGGFYAIASDASAVGAKISARLAHYIQAASNAVDTYTASITFFGQGPVANGAITAATQGITLSYAHDVNGGNYVISYRGDDTTLKTVNTSVAPGIGAANCKYLVAKAHRTAVGASTIEITLDGVSYSLTDTSFNTDATYVFPMLGSRILKSLGSTAVAQRFRHMAIACNLI